MRIIVWTLRLALFVFLLGFAIKNEAPVTVHAWLGTSWNVSLALLMLLLVAVGAVFGILSMLPTLIAMRRETSRLRKLRGEPAPQKNVRPQYPESV